MRRRSAICIGLVTWLVTPGAPRAATLHEYDASEDGQISTILRDTVGGNHFTLQDAEIVELVDTTTRLTHAYRLTRTGSQTGGAAAAFALRDLSFECWLRVGPLDDAHQVVFETGGGQNGTSLLLTGTALRILNSTGNVRSVDLEVSIAGLDLDDFLHVVVALDVTRGRMEVTLRDVVGGRVTGSVDASLGNGSNGASLFTWSSSTGNLGGSHVNLGGRTEVSGTSPSGLTQFRGEIALLRVHDLALDGTAIDALFDAVTRARPSIRAFTATPESIAAGETSTLAWELADASRVEIRPGPGDVTGLTVDGAGELTLAIESSTVFELVASDGALEARAVLEVLVDGQSAPPRITELLARHRDSIRDGDGESSDWIEIHNPSLTPFDLAGHYLSDDPLVPTRWPFPAIQLESDERLLVFASGRAGDPFDAEGLLHASFRLDGDRGWVGLVAPDGVSVLSSIEYGEQREDVSFGRSDPGGELRFFPIPTPGDTNGEGVVGFVSDTRFDVDRGFHDAPFPVTISSATEGALILYTLDGSAPVAPRGLDPGRGEPYTGPIEIAGTTTLRALAYLPGHAPTNVDTQTYLFLDEIVAQSNAPPGYPATWALRPADYEMDPEVVGESDLFGGVYRDSIREDLLSLPSLSIVMDRDDLFGPDGLYQNPQAEGVAWERAASVELIDPAGAEAGFRVDCGIRVQGGSSRSPDFPKHSFRLLFKDEYGPTKLRYPVFASEPNGAAATDRFDTIVLRAGFNNSWAHWHYFQNPRAQYIRDQFIRDSQLAMGWASPHGRFVHVYLNGIYWGFYNLCERPTAPFLAEYFGGDREDYETQNVNEPKEGDLTTWNEMMSIANAGVATTDAYARIREHLDVENLADYMLLNFYFGNDDWDGHNWYAGHRRDGAPGYGFFCWDSELVISRHLNPPPLPDFDAILTRDRTGIDGANRPSRLQSRLRLNAEYRLLFADRVQRHLFNGGALSPERIEERWLARRDQVWRAVVAESARWGDFRRDVLQRAGNPASLYDLFHRDAHFVAHQAWLLGTYFPQRPAIFLEQLRARSLWPDLAAPRFSSRERVIPAGGLALRMESDAGEIFFTIDGSDPRQVGGALAPAAIAYLEPIRIERETFVRARARSGTVWSPIVEVAYSLHRAARAGDLVIGELHFHPSPPTAAESATGYRVSDFEYLAVTSLATEAVDLAGARLAGGVRLGFREDRSLTVAAGETVYLVRHLEAFLARYGDAQIVGIHDGKLSDRGERIALVDRDGQLIDGFTYRDGGAWPRETDGRGCSLHRLADPDLDPDDPGTWVAGPSLAGGCEPTVADGIQLPGDCTQDGRVDLSDGVCVLRVLFLGDGARLPCGDGSITDPGNLALSDWQADRRLDLSDGVALLVHLFSGGPPHALGGACRAMPGCETLAVCAR